MVELVPLKIACSVFNDKDNLKRHLMSIPQYIHHEVWDGRYKDFDHPSLLSDDGTREIAQIHYNVQLFDAGGYEEVVKRQMYLDRFNPNIYKFLLVIDSDEYFEGDWQEFIYELDQLYDEYKPSIGNNPIFFTIDVMNPYHNKYNPRPRIWINANNVVMGPRHNQYRNKIDGSPLSKPKGHISNMKIKHDYKLRYETYDIKRKAYQKKLKIHDKYC